MLALGRGGQNWILGIAYPKEIGTTCVAPFVSQHRQTQRSGEDSPASSLETLRFVGDTAASGYDTSGSWFTFLFLKTNATSCSKRAVFWLLLWLLHSSSSLKNKKCGGSSGHPRRCWEGWSLRGCLETQETSSSGVFVWVMEWNQDTRPLGGLCYSITIA